ncbi:MAG: ABC transporter substrate-binding protein [Eubacteriales bacterium]|nr:ABC transporter substrate-binding protein [Eubacteriales bacterium]
MKKQSKRILAGLLAVLMAFSVAACGNTQQEQGGASQPEGDADGALMPLTVSHQASIHSLPSYIADKEGVFEENGLDVDILYFTSGPPQTEALGADEWDVGCIGSPPTIAANLAYNMKIIGLSVEDTVALSFWCRNDSDIAAYGDPDGDGIVGDAASWRGKTILCPLVTSWHFVLIATLNKLGLTEDDVNIIDMDASQAYTAMQAGQGDICALGFPNYILAEDEDWTCCATGASGGESMPTVLVASEKAISEKPDAVLAWLRSYYEVSGKYVSDNDALTKYFLEMQLEQGSDVDAGQAAIQVGKHTLPTLEDVWALFKGEYGKRKIDDVIYNIVDFYIAQGRYEPGDKDTLLENGFVDGQFIEKLAAEAGLK